MRIESDLWTLQMRAVAMTGQGSQIDTIAALTEERFDEIPASNTPPRAMNQYIRSRFRFLGSELRR